MTLLDELAERCEQATGAGRELSAAIALAVHDWLHEVEGNKPLNCRVRNRFGSPVYIGGETGRALDFTASLDAAMTLVPEGWRWVLRQATADKSKGAFFARLESGDFKSITWGKGGDYITDVVSGREVFVWAGTPALALCAVALKARSASVDTHPKGEDAQQASFMGSAVPEGQTP